jgi:chromosome segregation ATPase
MGKTPQVPLHFCFSNRSEKVGFDDEIDKLQNERESKLTRVKRIIDGLEREKNEFLERARAAEKKVEELVQDRNKAKETSAKEREELNVYLQQLESENEEIHREIQRTLADHEALKQQFRRTENLNNKENTRYESLVIEVKQQRDEFHRREREWRNAVADRDDDLAKLKHLNRLQEEQMLELRLKITQYIVTVKNKDDEILALEDKLENKNSKAEQNDDDKSLKIFSLQQQIIKLESEIQEQQRLHQQQLSQVSDKYDSELIGNEVGLIRQEISSKNAQLLRVTHSLKRVETAVKTVTDCLADLQNMESEFLRLHTYSIINSPTKSPKENGTTPIKSLDYLQLVNKYRLTTESISKSIIDVKQRVEDMSITMSSPVNVSPSKHTLNLSQNLSFLSGDWNDIEDSQHRMLSKLHADLKEARLKEQNLVDSVNNQKYLNSLLQSENANDKNIIADLQQRNRSQVRELKQQLKESNRKLKSLPNIESATAKMNDLINLDKNFQQEQLSRQISKIEGLELQISDLKTELGQSRERLKDVSTANEQLQSQLTDLRANLLEKENQVDTLSEQNNRMKRELSDFQGNLESVTRDILYTREDSERRIDLLKEENEMLRKNNERDKSLYEKHISDNENLIRSYKEQLFTKDKPFRNIEPDIDIHHFEDRMRELEQQYELERKLCYQKHQQIVEELNGSLKEAQEKNTQLEEVDTRNFDLVNQQLANYEKSQQSLQDLLSNLESENERLKNHIKSLEYSLDQSQQLILDQRKQLDSDTSIENELGQSNEQLENALVAFQTELATVTDQFEQVRNDYAELENIGVIRDKVIDDLKEQNEKLSKFIEEQNVEIESQEQEIQSITRDLEQTKRDRLLLEESSKQGNTLFQLRNVLEGKDLVIRGMEEDKEQLRSRLRVLWSQFKDLAILLQQTRQNQLDEVEQHKKELRTECESIRQEILQWNENGKLQLQQLEQALTLNVQENKKLKSRMKQLEKDEQPE